MPETTPLISEALLGEIQETARAQHRQPAEVLEEAWKYYAGELSWGELIANGRENATKLGIEEADIDRLIAEYRAEKHSR
jgi:hypothetical protein